MKRLLAFVPLAALLALAAAAVFVLSRGDRGDGFVSPMTGRPAPALVLAGLEGAPVETARFAGRPYVINFFASWCAPCEIEHPLLTEAQQDGAVILGVGYKDEAADIRGFLGRLGNPYSAVALDPDGTAAIELGVRKMPETFVVDASGVIVAHRAGPIDAAFLREALQKE